MVEGPCLELELEGQATIGQPIGQLDVLASQEGRIETAGLQEVGAADRGVPGVELPGGGRPLPIGHGLVLTLQLALLPQDPGLEPEVARSEKGSDHHGRTRSPLMGN